MKKFGLLFLSLLGLAMHAQAAKISVTIGTGALQPGTTAGINIASGTIQELSFVNGRSTGSFTLQGATESWVNGVSSGTKFDRSTTTLQGASFNGTATDNSTMTITGNYNFRNGVTVSTGPTQTAMFNVGLTSVTIVGATDGSVAATGNYAEEVSSAVAGNKAWNLTSGVYMDVATMTVTAGDWLLYGCVCFTGATTGTAYVADIVTTGGNSAAGQLGGDNMNQTPTSPTAAADNCLIIPLPQHVTPTTPTAYYLKCTAVFTVGTPKAYGTIRRVRNPH